MLWQNTSETLEQKQKHPYGTELELNLNKSLPRTPAPERV